MRKNGNTTLWFDDNFVGTELNLGVEYAKVAEGCGLKGVQVRTMDDLTEALDKAVDGQMKNNETTLIEVVLNQELGEPFRRDAMKKPVTVAGIDPADMRPASRCAVGNILMSANPFLSKLDPVCPEHLLTLAKQGEPARTAIVRAGAPLPMQAAKAAFDEGIMEPVFVGEEADIKSEADSLNWNISEFRSRRYCR